MHDHTLPLGKKHCCYCLQDFSRGKILKMQVNDCFKSNSKQIIKMSKKSEFLRFKNYERKIKSSFMIHDDFENILQPEDMESNLQMSLIQINIKNMSLPVMVIN